jgi:hypothetical protein
MLKKVALLALPMMAMSMSANASLFTQEQVQTYSGVAGNTSAEAGLDPFSFAKFDASLGDLQNVFVQLTFTIDGGLIGADNMTNEEVTGSGYLGGASTLSSNDAQFFAWENGNLRSVFMKQELVQNATFTLAADPEMTTGGNGPDVATHYGSPYSTTESFVLADFVNSDFVGAGESILVDYDTDSLVQVEVAGAQGFFQAVDSVMEMRMYYEYTEHAQPEINSVSSPVALAALGLGLMGFGAARRKKRV